MNILRDLSFRVLDSKVDVSCLQNKPSSFPPESDFIISIDSNGEPLSAYGDDCWDLRALGGRIMRFEGFSYLNKELFKQIMFVSMYHYALFPGSYHSVKSIYQVFQKFVEVCDESNHKITIDTLYKYPKVIEKIAKKVPESYFLTSITKLKQLLSISDDLGFVVLDEYALKQYSAYNPEYELGQTPVIPPRIWNYFIKKCDTVLESFLEKEAQISDAFLWLYDAYDFNKNLNLRSEYNSPFHRPDLHTKKRRVYFGGFKKFISDFELDDLLHTYIYPAKDNKNKNVERFEIRHFSALLTLGREISMLYILAYSLMRAEEASFVRFNGLSKDEDEQYGSLFVIESRTTKTEDDSEALFPTSSSVEKAFKVAGFIAKLRLLFSNESQSNEFITNPFLMTGALEVWRPGSSTENSISIQQPVKKYPFFNKKNLFLDDEQFRITDEDYQFAIALTPTLLLEREKNDWFKVGDYWKFSNHQFRRTLAVQMNEFGVSGGTIQYCMKHRTRQMQNHYTKNSSRIVTNKFAQKTFLNERIQQVYLKLADVIQNESGRYVKPYNKLQSVPLEIINLIEESNFKKLAKEIKAGKTGVRLTVLGVCVKKDICEYGGIESISPCMGEHDGSRRICGDAALDKQKKHDIQKYVNYCTEQQKSFEKGSPSFDALEKEIKAGTEAIKRMEAA